jgi:hypothetical protein
MEEGGAAMAGAAGGVDCMGSSARATPESARAMVAAQMVCNVNRSVFMVTSGCVIWVVQRVAALSVCHQGIDLMHVK